MSSATTDATRTIRVAHSPDSDDAFMFYALATGKVRVPGFVFEHALVDIETLNREAIDKQTYDVTAISFGAYPYMQKHYRLMACGGSVGDGYGPIVVATKPYTPEQIKKLRIAVPGELTTAYLTLRLFHPEIAVTMLPFDRIIPAVLAGEVEAGLLIHEGQLTYGTDGLVKIRSIVGHLVARPDRSPAAARRRTPSAARWMTPRSASSRAPSATASSTRSTIAKPHLTTRCNSPAILHPNARQPLHRHVRQRAHDRLSAPTAAKPFARLYAMGARTRSPPRRNRWSTSSTDCSPRPFQPRQYGRLKVLGFSARHSALEGEMRESPLRALTAISTSSSC